jgi:hypothetical protein
MVQGKTSGCTIVSLANMLDLMVIDEENKLKVFVDLFIESRINRVDE